MTQSPTLLADADRDELLRTIELMNQERLMAMRSLAHEVGTSLQGVLSYAGLLDASMPADVIAEHLAIIQESALRIAGAMEDLRHQNELDAGRKRLDLVDVDFSQALEELSYTFTLRYPQRTFDYRVVPGMLKVVGDVAHIQYVLGAAVRLVMRMSPEESDVHLSASANNSKVIVIITAKGAQLPEEDRSLVFDKFAALARDGRAHREVGLGLHVAREVARLMGGDIRLAVTVKGATAVQALFRPSQAL